MATSSTSPGLSEEGREGGSGCVDRVSGCVSGLVCV